jgi:hypothetical protein
MKPTSINDSLTNFFKPSKPLAEQLWEATYQSLSREERQNLTRPPLDAIRADVSRRLWAYLAVAARADCTVALGGAAQSQAKIRRAELVRDLCYRLALPEQAAEQVERLVEEFRGWLVERNNSYRAAWGQLRLNAEGLLSFEAVQQRARLFSEPFERAEFHPEYARQIAGRMGSQPFLGYNP